MTLWLKRAPPSPPSTLLSPPPAMVPSQIVTRVLQAHLVLLDRLAALVMVVGSGPGVEGRYSGWAFCHIVLPLDGETRVGAPLGWFGVWGFQGLPGVLGLSGLGWGRFSAAFLPHRAAAGRRDEGR